MKKNWKCERAPRGYRLEDDMYVSTTFGKRGYIPAQIKNHNDERLVRKLKKYTFVRNEKKALFICKFGGKVQTRRNKE